MKVIIGIFLFILLYGILGKATDAGDPGKTGSQALPVRDPAPEPLSPARALIQRYNNAYDSHDESELSSVVEDLIGSHYACFSAHEWGTTPPCLKQPFSSVPIPITETEQTAAAFP